MTAGSEQRGKAAEDPARCSLQPARWENGWFVVPWQVIFRDVDTFGHVNNAVYLTYFEWARAQLWFELNGLESVPANVGFIVARAEIDFILQIAMEPIEIRVRISEMRTTSFDTVYEILLGNRQLAATGKVVVVLFDWHEQRKIPITDELRQKVTERCAS